jgi:hypothetical protein
MCLTNFAGGRNVAAGDFPAHAVDTADAVRARIMDYTALGGEVAPYSGFHARRNMPGSRCSPLELSGRACK